ncbi:hypothetical protein DDE18_04745 [Nocardioides gansuensis]|uniref:Uncharacterized protein n=1 Tax=Nocardioides gansuensis TaxID=2138300 RepID=A0A2T8FD67_9ACTN|nr:hypothetical protein DDE18_04745 [Nocardioides gansuensis]
MDVMAQVEWQSEGRASALFELVASGSPPGVPVARVAAEPVEAISDQAPPTGAPPPDQPDRLA